MENEAWGLANERSERSERSEHETRFARGTRVERLTDEAPEPEECLAEIVHDMKSPLATIGLEASLLAEQLLRCDRTAGLRSLEHIHHNVEYLDRLIHDLLDMGRKGPLPLYREPVEIRGLIESVLDRIITAHDRPRVRLDAPSAQTLVIDAHRIERVLANLVDNALKYTPSPGRVIVRLETGGGIACVSVIDEGPGLHPDEIATVFDRYRRASTSRGRKGCGLGLYVSKKIISAHGGRMDVDSIRGVGSRFSFQLPA
ncbi:MAG TPA: HAMP domain-containing sensor histidine kinase [Kofleriaceae bacterium]|nr:HAMP domain-containing sensor histidine kinase [Kofleriaceae bacterium]